MRPCLPRVLRNGASSGKLLYSYTIRHRRRNPSLLLTLEPCGTFRFLNEKAGLRSVQAQTDDFSTMVDQHVELAVQVRVERAAVLGVGRVDTSTPEFAAVIPGHLVRVSEYGAQAAGIAVEIQFEFPIAPARVRPCEDLPVDLFVFVIG